MRRFPVLLLVIGMAACGGTEALPRLSVGEASVHGILRVADPGGISLLDTDEARITTRIRDGVRSRDWVFQSRLTAKGTQLAAVSPLGEIAWHRDVEGDLSTRVVSSDGTRVALLPYGDANVDPYHPEGRATTSLTVVSTDDGGLERYELDGNFEPEAFATSGDALFVIEYVPALAPERYRVRKLDLTTSEVGPVFSVDGHLQESMRGTARVQALSADGSRLYTLYTTEQSAFVHVLDLAEEWAHCVDLPAPIGSSPEQQLAVAADATGDRVLVVDALAGIAEIDARSLAITRTAPFAAPERESGQAMAVVDDDGRLLAGRGTVLVVVDRDLAEEAFWLLPTPMLGLYRDPERDLLWVLGADRLYALDDRTGEVVETAPLPEEMPTLQVPPAPEGAPIQCAC